MIEQPNIDIWDKWHDGHWIVITTNGDIKNNGEAVMGRGIALQAKQVIPPLPFILGILLRQSGNCVHVFSQYHIFTFPTKHHWSEKADPQLIYKSAAELNQFRRLINGYTFDETVPIYVPCPGCGNGGLKWEDIKDTLALLLDNRFIIVHKQDRKGTS